MAEAKDQHDQAIVLERHDEPVVADPAAPKPGELAGEGLAEPAWIGWRGDALAQIAQDRPPRRLAELAQLLGGIAIELDAPAQRAHLAGPAPSSFSSAWRLIRPRLRPRRSRARCASSMSSRCRRMASRA